MVTALRSHTAPARLANRRRGIGFWLASYVFAITIAFSAVPAPLYVLYQARDHFGSLLVTVIFAVYALGWPPAVPVLADGARPDHQPCSGCSPH